MRLTNDPPVLLDGEEAARVALTVHRGVGDQARRDAWLRLLAHIDAQADRIQQLEGERDGWERAHHDAFDREATLAVRLANVDRPAASLDGKDEGDA